MLNLRTAIAVVAALGMGWSGVSTAAPLAQGKPAGVKQAQIESVPPLVWIGLAGMVAAGAAAAASSGNSASTFNTVAASTGTGTTS